MNSLCTNSILSTTHECISKVTRHVNPVPTELSLFFSMVTEESGKASKWSIWEARMMEITKMEGKQNTNEQIKMLPCHTFIF